MTARTEEVAEFAVLPAEAVNCIKALEAANALDPALDAAMALFEPVVQISDGQVSDGLAQHGADRPPV